MRKRVLIVDNIQFRAEKLARLCRTLGFGVLLSSNGPDGLRRAAQDRPDLFLLDSSAASVGLKELAQVAAEDERTSSIPIVALVSAGDIRTVNHYRRLGVHIVPRDLPAALRHVLSDAAESADLAALFSRRVAQADAAHNDMSAAVA